MTQADIFTRTNGRPHPATILGEAILLANGSIMIRPARGVQLSCTDLADTRILPDGSLVIEFFQEEISTEDAARILRTTIPTVIQLTRTYDREGKPLLRSRVANSHRIWIKTASVFEHRRATEDPEFWERI